MGNLKKRLEHLGGGRRKGAPIIIVEEGETSEDAWQRHLAEYPEDAEAEVRIVIQGSDEE